MIQVQANSIALCKSTPFDWIAYIFVLVQLRYFVFAFPKSNLNFDNDFSTIKIKFRDFKTIKFTGLSQSVNISFIWSPVKVIE